MILSGTLSKLEISKGEGGILLFSYKVVDFFVDIIYESTLGGYEKVLGISRPEKKIFEFWHPLPYTGGTGFGAIFPYFYLISSKNGQVTTICAVSHKKLQKIRKKF